ncbi:MAG: hypothetical protein ACT4OM_08390 [Actinomycetota bacterium]
MRKELLLGTDSDDVGVGSYLRKLPGRLKMKRHQLLVMGLASLTAVSLMSVGAVAVDPVAEEEHQQTVFRGGGSDTTYELLVALDTLYNNSPGCLTVDTRVPSGSQGTQHLHNNTCQMEDIADRNSDGIVDEDNVAPIGGPTGATGHPPFGFDPDGPDPVDGLTPQSTRRANYDHDVIMQYFPLGSSFGVRQLQRQESPITPAPATGTEHKCGRYTATTPAPPTGPPPGAPVTKDCAPLDFARSSSARSATEIGTGLRQFGFAREGLSWVCFALDDTGEGQPSGCAGGSMNPDGVLGDPDGSGPLLSDDNRTLTHAQIRGIMACDPSFDEWHEVGGAGSAANPIPIRVYQAQGGSGTRSSWDAETGITTLEGRLVGENGVPTKCVRTIFENDARAIDPSEQGMAFFYFSSARHTKPEASFGTVLNKIDGVAVSPTSVVGCVGAACSPPVASGVERKPAFPYTRTVWNVIRHSDPQGNNAPKELREYLSETGFLCKSSANHVENPRTGANFRTSIRLAMEKEGYFSLPVATHGIEPGMSHCRINSDPAIVLGP